MSLKAWVKKHYVKAKDGYEAEASLRKWEGLTKKTLKEYGIFFDGWGLAPYESLRESFPIDSDTCHLCVRHQYASDDELCRTCPLYIVRDYVPCDLSMSGEDKSPFHAFLDNGDARPMIKWLRRAVKYERKQREAKKCKK